MGVVIFDALEGIGEQFLEAILQSDKLTCALDTRALQHTSERVT
jgi:hypothetical protein